MMTLDRAREIVAAINARCFVSMEIAIDLPSLGGVSLADMVEAAAMVRNVNQAAATTIRPAGAYYTIEVVPDDRLIAAVYAIENYPTSREPVIALPAGGGRFRAIAVIQIEEKERA